MAYLPPEPRRRMGRPPLPARLLRDQRIVTLVTGEEKRRLLQLARERNTSLSQLCHELLSEALTPEEGQ